MQDENSKLGTLLDDEQIRGQSKILTKDEHVVKLGTFEQLFRWVTYSSLAIKHLIVFSGLNGTRLS